MFTGLVQTTGVVRELQPRPESVRVVITAALADNDRAIGASVCVSGVCLTVTESSPEQFAADIGFETLAVTTFGPQGDEGLRVGTKLNLEPSLRLGDSLGGHLVSGHVDGVGQVRHVVARGDAREVWIDVPEPLRRYVAVKGSVAVDGVSLTVNAVDEAGFMVGLIPHTLEVTTLGDKLDHPAERRSRVNLEVDMLARYVERLLQLGSVRRGPDELVRRNNPGDNQGDQHE